MQASSGSTILVVVWFGSRLGKDIDMGHSELREKRDKLLERARESGNALQRYLVAVNGLALAAILGIARNWEKDGGDCSWALAWASAFFAFSLSIAGMVLWRNLRQGSKGLDKLDELIDRNIDKSESDSELENYRKTMAKPYAKSTQRFQILGYIIFLIGVFISVYFLFCKSMLVCIIS